MSNLPPNPFVAGQVNANPGPQLNHSQQFGQVPLSQLPPGYGGLKQDANSNSPLPPSSTSLNSAINQVNNYNQSASSSPAFNHPGMMPPPQTGLQSSPMRPLKAPLPPSSNQSPLPPANVPLSSASRTIPNSNASPIPLTSYQQRQINDNAPPLIPSSHPHLVNGPPMGPPGVTSQPPSQFLPSSNSFGPPLASRPSVSAASFPLPMNPLFGQHQAPAPPGPPTMKAPGTGPVSSQSNVPFSGPPLSGPQRNSPFMAGHVGGLPVSSGQSGPANSGPPVGPPRSMGLNGPSLSGPPVSSVSGVTIGPPKGPGSGLPLGPMGLNSGPPGPSVSGLPVNQYPASQKNGPSGPSMGPPIGSIPFSSGQMGSSTGPMGPPTGPLGTPGLQTGKLGPPGGPMGPPAPSHPPGPMGPPPGPMGSPPGPMGPPSGPMGPPSGPMGPPSGPMGPATGHMGPPTGPMGPSGLHSGLQSLPMGAQSLPPVGHQMGPPLSAHPGPPSGMLSGQKSNMQGRYPQMPSSNYINNQPGMPPQAGVPPQAGLPPTNIGKQYPQQYNAQGMTQQMGQLSVTKQGFDQLWGHQMVDLLACRQILPEYPEDPPEIKLAHQFAESPNCSPDIFRCTINRIPETNSLLQKSRLPLGILIHPFKDLNHLPVIQCTTIVRCRACRTYINPFVYFVDAKRWKCNLCYRVNDLPEEFQYDPVSKSYGDPSRRPEIKSATIEFIAPGEYMLRPPQPAVYLFLMDVSQIARDSGYLQVLCDTLKNSLDQLPGDARTQVGFICFDAHIHYYLMSDGLTRPKEMTVLDIDDVFLPSPESLLVNLGERRELVKELLSVLPQRHSGPGVPSSALGAALQAAYKLMAPTGGRITVFQTCLPNVGPGALQAREDPNARSSADVPHLNPSTDFYKRLALDCSGAQVAVDLFLLNAQYADLATLSGMSKFSGGTLYHIPLFRAARTWQCDQLTRMLTRYLTRKIGFEAVMRVRCTRGIAIHTFHGNFFVRSTDLLSLPNVSPDAGFGMQLTIEESLSDLQQVCFQAALLYTSSKGERRIRVHTMALPIASNLTDVLHSADQQCIVGLLSKMAVDRCASASMQEAREALMNVAVDALSAHRLAQNLPAGGACAGLMAPASLRLLPLYLLALLKRKAFRTGTSTRLDDRVADMNDMKTLPLAQLLRAVYPDLYPIHNLRDVTPRPDDDDEPETPDPPRLHLSAERINSSGAYLLDDGEQYTIYVCHAVSGAFLSDTLGVAAFSQVPDEARSLPRLPGEGNALLHAFIDKLNDDRPYASNILILRDNSPNRQLFTERLVDDRVESSFAYYEFLQHIKIQVK